MSAIGFLQDLSVVLLVAAVVLFIFRKLGWPPVLGYLAAGLIIGPHTPPMPLVKDIPTLEVLAEIGVVFLLFALGVEFSIKRLAKVGLKALVVAGIEAFFMVLIGYAAGSFFGWSSLDSLLFGGTIALASTAIVARVLLERRQQLLGWEELVAGTLIAEDMIAMLLIAFFSSASQLVGSNLSNVLSVVIRFGMLLTLMLTVGLLVLPRILRAIERTGMEEVRTLAVVGICFGTALLTEKLGFSVALGAFLAGAMSSMGGYSSKLHETVAPFKDVFGGVFFVAVGMLIDPRWLIKNWQIVGILAIVVLLGRMLFNFLALSVAGEKPSSALQATLVMLPIGEFSFVLAQVGHRHGIVQQPIYPLAVTLCLVTTVVSSLIFPRVIHSSARIEKLMPNWTLRWMNAYHAELSSIRIPSRLNLLWQLLRPSLIQILLNFLGISTLFIAAQWVGERWTFLSIFPGALWMLAALISLPFLIALLRKTHAASLILLEAISTARSPDALPLAVYPILTRLILSLVAILVILWYLSLSSNLLPAWPHTLWPLILVAAAGILLWRRMNRFYAKIQLALRETLAREEAKPEASATALSHFLSALSPEKMQVATISLDSQWWAIGKSIKETALRAKTGTNILQINRNDEAIASPEPEIILKIGDELLLMGEIKQIEQARLLLRQGSL